MSKKIRKKKSKAQGRSLPSEVFEFDQEAKQDLLDEAQEQDYKDNVHAASDWLGYTYEDRIKARSK